MKVIIKYSGVFLLLLNLCACQKGGSTPAAYVTALEKDDRLVKTVTVGAVDYIFKLMPPELLALNAASDAGHQTDAKLYNDRLKELKGHLYIKLDMQMHDKQSSVLKYQLKSMDDYQQRVMYYEFYAVKDIKLIADGIEIAPESYQYENHLSLMPYNTIMLAFPLKDDMKNVQMVFNDQALNNLFVKANFNIQDLKKLPYLTLN